MKVGVIQSNYIPWRGYFDFIASVDLFIIYDEVAFSKGSYRNRNQLKFAEGLRWLAVPVDAHLGMPVAAVRIDSRRRDWAEHHKQLLRGSLEAAPYFADAFALWRSGTVPAEESLSTLNVRLIRSICEYLGIRTPLIDSRQFGAVGRSTERLIDLLRKVGADAYLSGPVGKEYLDEDLFRRHAIRLEYKSYDYEPYPQLHGPFVGSVSVLDLVANCGPESRRYLKSRTPDQAAVP